MPGKKIRKVYDTVMGKKPKAKPKTAIKMAAGKRKKGKGSKKG